MAPQWALSKRAEWAELNRSTKTQACPAPVEHLVEVAHLVLVVQAAPVEQADLHLQNLLSSPAGPTPKMAPSSDS